MSLIVGECHQAATLGRRGRELGYGPETSSRVTANSSRQPWLETGSPSISVRVHVDAAG